MYINEEVIIMRYFSLFWDALYAITLGSMAAAGFATVNLCIKKRADDRRKEKEQES